MIGLIPLVGDIFNAYLSYTVIRLANNIDGGLPIELLVRMTGNVVLDFLIGITPILGSVAGALYKANSRNSLVLERYLKERARVNLTKGLYRNGIDKSPNKSAIDDTDPLLRTVNKEDWVLRASQQNQFL